MKGIWKWLVLGIAVIWIAVWMLPDGNLHVVFCDVGQGDAILLIRGTTQVLVDGGPGEKVQGCLSRHMPFYDRRVEMVILTHAEADHLTGLINVVKRYTVLQFVEGSVGKNSAEYRELVELLGKAKIKRIKVTGGDIVRVNNLVMRVVWPESQYELGAETEGRSLNNFSLGMIAKYGDFEVFLSGDGDSQIEEAEIRGGRLMDVEVLKVPHHGSRTGMTKEWLELIRPELAVISAGRNNSYGHPASESLRLLEEVGAKIAGTYERGDVEVISDGKVWWIK
jgi:competence protein ComEC